MKKKNIVIMGAGPAGLTAAYYLLSNSKNKYNVIILEKEKQVGGISKTIDFNGYKIDTGIHRFFTKNDEVNKIWHELLPTQGKPSYEEILLNEENKYDNNDVDPEKDNCLLIKRRVTRILYGGKFYDYPVNINFTTIKNMGFITIIKAIFSYLKSTIKKLPETSLENYYINRFGKVLYSMFFESYTEKVWGISPKDISADWGSQRVKGISIKEVVKDFFRKKFHKKNKANTETSLIEQFIYPKLGSGNIYEIMAQKIEDMGGVINYNTSIEKIVVKNNKIVEVKTSQETISVDTLISSIPIKELMHLFNNVKKDILKLTDDLPYREFMSVGLVVNDFNLKNTTKYKTLMNIVPDSWIYVQEKSVKMGRIQIFNNWSPYMFRKKDDIKDKVMFSLEYFCSHDDEYWNMSDKEFINFAIGEAEKLGIIKKENVLSSIRIKVDKAYPAYFGSYKDIDKIVDYLNTYKNLYCIGRNGQHRYNNMDHSMLTGIEAAKSIINNSSDRKPIWNVNTEKDYHEQK